MLAHAHDPKQRNDTKKREECPRMLVEAPGTDHWSQVNNGIGRIFENYVVAKRLAGKEAFLWVPIVRYGTPAKLPLAFTSVTPAGKPGKRICKGP